MAKRAVNQTMDAATAKLISSLFVEVVAAPEYAPDALDIFMSTFPVRRRSSDVLQYFS